MDDAKDELIIEPDFELVKDSVKNIKEPLLKVISPKSESKTLSSLSSLTTSLPSANNLTDDIVHDGVTTMITTPNTEFTNPTQDITPFYISMFYKENRKFLIHIVSDLILFYFFFSYTRNQFYITEQMIQLAKKRIIEYKESKGLQ
jgi:hypothetical protein